LLPLQRAIFSSIVVNLLLTQIVLDLSGLIGKNEQLVVLTPLYTLNP
jgi:hypothetical protein